MAISQQAAQQVAALLTQSLGLPGGQGAEIAQRLLSASNPSGNNSSRTSSNRTISRDNITTGFRNQFRPAEQPPFQSQSGIDGKDGTAGQGGRDGVAGAAGYGATGATGATGSAGQDGAVDYDSIRRFIDGLLVGLLPDGDGGSDALRKILKDFYDQLKILDDKIKKPPICGGRNICDTLKDINGELKKAKRERKELKDKLKKLDERLKEAEKQNDEISKYLPPEECS